jgi:hypothetical protein
MSNESLSFSKAGILGQTRQISQVFETSILIDKHWVSSKFFNERCSCAVGVDLFPLSLPWKQHVIFDIHHKHLYQSGRKWVKVFARVLWQVMILNRTDS